MKIRRRLKVYVVEESYKANPHWHPVDVRIHKDSAMHSKEVFMLKYNDICRYRVKEYKSE